MSRERFVDPDQEELGWPRFEVFERLAVCAGAQTTSTPCGRECRPTFGIGEETEATRWRVAHMSAASSEPSSMTTSLTSAEVSK